MKRGLIFLICIYTAITNNAQDYLISFAGAGGSSVVSSVKVDNLTQNVSLTMNGGEVLHLMGTITEIETIKENKIKKIDFYPNPMTDYTRMKFVLHEADKISITLYDISGKKMIQTQRELLEGEHIFLIKDLKEGMYVVKITSTRASFSGKLLCLDSKYNNAQLEYEYLTAVQNKETVSKGASGEVVMQYTTGDRLKFTGTTDNFNTIIVDVPVESKTITFDFIPCTDSDVNSYKIVKIGDDLWMAENLRTTKNINGISITNITDDTEWYSTNTAAYCWYSNNTANASSYGALYNGYAVNPDNICPSGWRIPNETDWYRMFDVIGGMAISGGGLKEQGTIHWDSPNFVSVDFGFDALPGGLRHNESLFGMFAGLRTAGYYWSFYNLNTERRLFSMYNNLLEVKLSGAGLNIGGSVRCIKIY